MKGTLDYISKSVKVVLTNDATQKGVSIDKDGTIMLTMYHKGAAGGEVFGLQSLLFVQGVNEIQSFGRLINPKGIAYQDEVNLESLARLDAYAQNAGSEHILEALKNHYSEKTVRPGKDIEGVKLVRQAVKSLGGARGINCRAGKDRTAQEVNDDLAAEAVNTPQTAHHKDSIRQRLAGGISYTITGYNTGKANAYAFNKFQLPMLPAEWRPPAKYCGSEPT